MDDAALVERYLSTGDADGFRQIVERYRAKAYRLAVSILGPGNEAESEELVQDVFLVVHDRLGQLRGRSSLGSWIYRITYNEAVDRVSLARHRRPHLPDDEALAGRADPAADPFTGAAARQEAARVRAALAELPDLYRSALHLRYWLELDVREIAEVLQAPEGTVKSYLFRARRRLAQVLAEEGPT